MLGMAIKSKSWSFNACWCSLAYANACCSGAPAALADIVYTGNAATSSNICNIAQPKASISNSKLACHRAHQQQAKRQDALQSDECTRLKTLLQINPNDDAD
jgi:hypothetical protein